jgi:Dolichyl-phosphate-mannose-protein mannosyltransferase
LLAAVCSATVTLVAAYIAVRHHTVFVWHELDGYSQQAEQLLAAKWPRDVYRPALYVILTALGGTLLGDCFLAGKMISAIAAGGVVWLSYRLGLRLGGTRAGLIACALAASNSLLLTNSILAATDMLFALHFHLALLMLLRFCDRPSPRRALWAGGALALAWFTRYQSVALLPVMIATVVARSTRQERGRHVLSFAIGATIGLVPHMTVSWLQFRKPFHDENWRSLALRHFGTEGDWAYLYNNPFHGLLSVLRHDPQSMLRTATSEAWDFLQLGLPQSMGLATPGALYAVALLLLASGTKMAARRDRAATLVALSAAGSYTALLCFTFHANHRFCLPLVPIASAVMACAIASISALDTERRMLREVAWRGLAAAACVHEVACSHQELRDLIRSQPTEIVAFAQDLAQEATAKPRVVSNYGPLHHYGAVEHLYAPIAVDTENAWQGIRASAAKHQADYVLCHRLEAWRNWDAFTAQPTPADFELVATSRDFRAYRPRNRH